MTVHSVIDMTDEDEELFERIWQEVTEREQVKALDDFRARWNAKFDAELSRRHDNATKEFDPDQPRDESGKWASNGAGSGATATAPLPPPPPVLAPGVAAGGGTHLGHAITLGERDESGQLAVASLFLLEKGSVYTIPSGARGFETTEEAEAHASAQSEATGGKGIQVVYDVPGGAAPGDQILVTEKPDINPNVIHVTGEVLPPGYTPPAPEQRERPSSYQAARSIEEAAEFTKALGVTNTNYKEGDLPLVNEANRQFFDITEKNPALVMPRNVIVDDRRIIGSEDDIAGYERGADALFLYRTPAWNNLQQISQQQGNARAWSDGNPNHVITHELAHREHAEFIERLPDVSWTPTQTWDSRDQEVVATRVSRYAVEAPNEFVAETYTAMLNGKTYDSDVMDLYHELDGPPLPKHPESQKTWWATRERKEFDPGQPRDESGKWTSLGGGGVGGGGGTAVLPPPPPPGTSTTPPTPKASQSQLKDALAKRAKEVEPWNLEGGGFVARDGTVYDIGLMAMHEGVAREVMQTLDEDAPGDFNNVGRLGETYGVVRVFRDSISSARTSVGVESYSQITADQMDTIRDLQTGTRGGVTWDHFSPEGTFTRSFDKADDLAKDGRARGFVKTVEQKRRGQIINNTIPVPVGQQLPKSESGYERQRAPYGCQHCKHFDAANDLCLHPDRDDGGPTLLVEGTVTNEGCCNLWNTDDVPAHTLSQREAEYVQQPGTDFRCEDCIVFDAVRETCGWVRGKIRATDSCNKWWYIGWALPAGHEEKDFDPDQPRGEDGKWTSGDGGAAVGEGPLPPPPPTLASMPPTLSNPVTQTTIDALNPAAKAAVESLNARGVAVQIGNVNADGSKMEDIPSNEHVVIHSQAMHEALDAMSKAGLEPGSTYTRTDGDQAQVMTTLKIYDDPEKLERDGVLATPWFAHGLSINAAGTGKVASAEGQNYADNAESMGPNGSGYPTFAATKLADTYIHETGHNLMNAMTRTEFKQWSDATKESDNRNVGEYASAYGAESYAEGWAEAVTRHVQGYDTWSKNFVEPGGAGWSAEGARQKELSREILDNIKSRMTPPA